MNINITNRLHHFGGLFLTKFTLVKSTLSALLFLLTFNGFGQLSVTTNLNKALYEANTSAQFVINSDVSGTVNYVLKYDDTTTPIVSSSVTVTAGSPQYIFHTEATSGVVICEVSQGMNTAVTSAAFSPYDIDPMEPAPSDLDNFWTTKKADLAAVPMNPVVTLHSTDTYSTTYKIILDNIDSRKVYGYLSVPTGTPAKTGPFPAVITLPPYGNVANITVPEKELAERAGVLSFSVSIHNVDPTMVDPNAYLPDDYTDPDKNYYKFALLGAVRAIDYLHTRSDFDKVNLGVTGISQGAGLSLNLAGIDDRINLLMYSVPALTQNAGLAHQKAGGFPNYVNNSRNSDGSAAHEAATIDATRYYDGMFQTPKCDYPVMANMSYLDLVTPMATGFAAFNELPNSAPRIVYHSLDLGHSSPPEYSANRYDFIHRYFPSSVAQTPWPFNNVDGYAIDAGTSTTGDAGSPIALSASIENETSPGVIETNPAYELEWSKVSGPGTVTFSAANAYSSNATFSAPGTYVLQFKGEDNAGLVTSSKVYSALIDYVTVTVNAVVLPVELMYFTTSQKDGNVLLQWETASEVNNAGFEIQRRAESERDFVKIGWVEKTTNTNGGFYDFWDKNIIAGKTYYYRLKQIDFDGAFEFSNIEVERLNADKFQVQLFPNPVNDFLNIQLTSQNFQKGELQLLSSIGTLLRSQPLEVTDRSDLTLDLQGLNSGIYFLVVKMNQEEAQVFSVFKK